MALVPEGGERLTELVSRVWGAPAESLLHGPQAVRRATGQRFLPLPPDNPRILLPLEGKEVVGAPLLGNLALRRRKERLPRRVAARALRSARAASWIERSAVGIPPPAKGPTLLQGLQEHVGADVAGISMTLRPPSANYKPTFTLVRGDGTVAGYGKIGTSRLSSARLDVEATALKAMGADPVPGLATPALVANFRWGGCQVLAVEALPETARRFPSRRRRPPTALLLNELARDRTAPMEKINAVMVDIIGEYGDEDLVLAALDYAADLAQTHRGQRLPVGRVHGDWVPWNLALEGERVWAWDWEHANLDTNLAVDVVLWHQLRAQHQQSASMLASLQVARREAASDLVAVGYTDAMAGAATASAVLHIAARNALLAFTAGMASRDVMDDLVSALTGSTATD